MDDLQSIKHEIQCIKQVNGIKTAQLVKNNNNKLLQQGLLKFIRNISNSFSNLTTF